MGPLDMSDIDREPPMGPAPMLPDMDDGPIEDIMLDPMGPPPMFPDPMLLEPMLFGTLPPMLPEPPMPDPVPERPPRAPSKTFFVSRHFKVRADFSMRIKVGK